MGTPPRWDRIFETGVKRGATDILLYPGCPPFLRLKEGLRALQIDALSASDVANMAAELLKPEEGLVRAENYASIDVTYGQTPPDKDVRFRLTLFHEPSPTFVWVLRLPHSAPLVTPTAEVQHLGLSFGSRLLLVRLLDASIERGGSDTLLVDHSKVLYRVGDGFQTAASRHICDDYLQRVMDELQPPQYGWMESDSGYRYSDITYREKWIYRIALFGNPKPVAAILMSLSTQSLS